MNDYEFNFNNDKTYQALFRIYQENKFEISLAEMDSYFEINMFFQKSKKELSEEEIIRIESMLKDFFTKYNKYFSLNNASIDEKQKAYSDIKILLTK